MTETNQTIGKQISFCQLFIDFPHVQIPIIQRDYAQGRPGQEELRQGFLSALKQALDANDNDAGIPLDLDFVYGSGFGGDGSHEETGFAPLDGQQRLTTLFLLHWYFAWKDRKVDDFQERFLTDQRSRFSYEVRPSSHDFFNRLALNFPEEAASGVTSVRALIEDKSWFFKSWKNDPTIVSSLTMIEEIHRIFSESEGYYQRLTDPEHPRITFQLLELEHFGLSDDLYIKMNARGKPLTPFETFKARLEQHLDELLPDETRLLHGRKVPIKEYFSHRMDTAWADLFWERRNRDTNLYDDEIMRLIKAVALVNLDPDSEDLVSILNNLRTLKTSVSFARFFDYGCLNERMLKCLVALMDYWSGTNLSDWAEQNTFNSRAAFYGATNRELPYPELTKFAAFCGFVRTHPLPLDLECLSRWLRVVSNLVENTDIERPTDFISVLRSLKQLEAHADCILEYMKEGSELTAFNRQQVREERIKAALILKGEAWKGLIFAAEEHGYFKGQIEFLLAFSGVLNHWSTHNSIVLSDEEDRDSQKLFSKYWERAQVVFDTNGLRPFQDHLWERALLALGDYTFGHGTRNMSFLQNRVGSGERRPTWKLLLRGHMADSVHEEKRQLVKELFDKLDPQLGVEESLNEVINTTSADAPWRQMLVSTPQLILYCDQKMFRPCNDGCVFLISKLRTSSDHVELWSYYLYHTLLTKMRNSGELSPFTLNYHVTNADEVVPFVGLKWSNGPVVIEIAFTDGHYTLSLEIKDTQSQQFLIEEMSKSFKIAQGDEQIVFATSPSDIESTLNEIVRIARIYDEKSPHS